MGNIFSFLQTSTSLYPDNVYVVDNDINYTYSRIYNKVNVLASLMYDEGVKSGDRVLVFLDNSAEYIAVYFGILRLNAIIVPINKSVSLESIQYIIEETSPQCIITNRIFMLRLQSKIDLKQGNMIDIDRIWETEMVLKPDFPITLEGDDERPAMILYTSGTTRMPKGVTLTHKNLLANTASIVQYLGLTKEDSLLAVVEFSFSYGNSHLLTHTKVGGKLVIENRVSYPLIVLEQIYKSEASGFATVGSYINILLKQDGLKDYHFKYLRYITFAGESTSVEDVKRLNEIAPHLKIFVMYGQTEASPRLSYLDPELIYKKAGSIGKGIPGVTLKVVKEDGMETAAGEIGEIIASGDNIMKGYWNNEEETKAVIKDGWLYTGDLAVTDEDGYIYFKGRKDDIIKYFGHRISPVEIETAINSCENILESAVIGIENSKGKQIKAVVVPKNSLACIEDINAHVRKILPAFMRPHIIEFVDELPRTSNGKIKRSELRKEIIHDMKDII